MRPPINRSEGQYKAELIAGELGCRCVMLPHGNFALVDEGDYERINKNVWTLSPQGYAVRTLHSNGIKQGLLMHREVFATPKGISTDHVNGNKLDNRRCNLRAADHRLNSANRPKRKPNNNGTHTSKFKGVYWDKSLQKFVANSAINGKHVHLGVFKTEEEAAEKYNEFALEQYGQYAYLNKV